MESRDGRVGGGVTWHGMFLRVAPRRVFGVVAAFTLMMQFHPLPASNACSSATARLVLIRL